MRNFEHEHRVLSEAYYILGNRAELSPGEFIRLHDTIWLDMAAEKTLLLEQEVTDAREDIEKRARAADQVKKS